MFYIKSSNEYWTGCSWSTRIETAREYDFEEGLDVIDKRFSKGIRKVRRHSGEPYYEPVPLLVTDQTGQKREI